MTNKSIRDYINLIENAQRESVTEMDKSAPQPGRDGRVSHSTYGSRDKGGSKGPEQEAKPITAKKAAQDALDILKKQGVAEGDVVSLGKKHRGDLDSVHSCPKCGGDLQGGKYMGHAVKVCQPCKQVYLPPNSGIDQQGNKMAEQGVAEEQLEETTPEAIAKINNLTRRS